MTTDNSAKAQTDDSGLKESIAQAVADTEETQGVAVTADQLDSILEQKLKPVLDRVQGRAQTYYGSRLKEETTSIRQQTESELAQVVSDFSQVLDEDQREAFLSLRQQRNAERQQKEMSEALDFVRQQKESSAQPVKVAMSQDDIALLNEEANDVIEQRGLDGMSRESQELWAGWQPSMTFAQSLALMKKNARSLKAKAPAPAAKPGRAQDSVPPSIADAPVVSDPGVMTLGEAAAAVRQGNITNAEFREIGLKKGWFR